MKSRDAVVLFAIVLAAGIFAGRGQSARANPATRDSWVTQDIIDERIDVDAQYALIRMCRTGEGDAAADATSILWAIIEDRSLAGIYQIDRGAPAKRARALDTWYWLLIPKGKNATCVKGPAGELPMIVYHPRIATYPEHLDPALREAWKMCGLPARDPLPCQIARRPPLFGPKDCPEEEQAKFMATYFNCMDETFYNTVPLEAEVACDKLCLSAKDYFACAANHAVCAPLVKARKHCNDYASKHTRCSREPR